MKVCCLYRCPDSLERVPPYTYRATSHTKLICIFLALSSYNVRTLPWPSVLRVWDMFFFEGVKVLHRTALALLALAFQHPADREKCSEYVLCVCVCQFFDAIFLFCVGFFI